MAYKPSDLSVIAYANGFTLWHYKTEDSPAAVQEKGYFDETGDMLRIGDRIMVNMAEGLSGDVTVKDVSEGVTVASITNIA